MACTILSCTTPSPVNHSLSSPITTPATPESSDYQGTKYVLIAEDLSFRRGKERAISTAQKIRDATPTIPTTFATITPNDPVARVLIGNSEDSKASWMTPENFKQLCDKTDEGTKFEQALKNFKYEEITSKLIDDWVMNRIEFSFPFLVEENFQKLFEFPDILPFKNQIIEGLEKNLLNLNDELILLLSKIEMENPKALTITNRSITASSMTSVPVPPRIAHEFHLQQFKSQVIQIFRNKLLDPLKFLMYDATLGKFSRSCLEAFIKTSSEEVTIKRNVIIIVNSANTINCHSGFEHISNQINEFLLRLKGLPFSQIILPKEGPFRFEPETDRMVT